MARSLLANAFFLGSVLVTGALANDPHANTADLSSIPDAHAMQEQGRKFNMNKARGRVAKAIRTLDNAKRNLDKAKNPDNAHGSCKALAERCEANWPAAGDKVCDQSEKTARKDCSKCNKMARKCSAVTSKIVGKRENQVIAAETKLNSAEQQCRSKVSQDLSCGNFCGSHGKPTIEASNCVCTCDEGWFGATCDKTSTVRMPPSTPVTPCCEPGARSMNGTKPAKWRASFPDDSLNSRMPSVVKDASSEGSTVSVVCDHTRNGPLAVKHELSKTSATVHKSKRCESSTHDEFRPLVGSLKQAPVSGIEKGKETFYGMSVYLGGKNDDGTWAWPFNNEPADRADSTTADILFQWKGFGEDKGTADLDAQDPNKKPDCDGRPFMTLQQKRSQLVLTVRAEKATLRLVEEVDRAQWYDIRIRVRWETDGSKGEVEAEAKPASQSVWEKAYLYGDQRGNKVWRGATMTGNFDAYLKWGLYLPHWQEEADGKLPENEHTHHSTRAVWHDNIAVGDCWQSVDPTANDCDASEAAAICNTADQ